MTKTFHMTNGMRIGTTILTVLLRAGLPFGSLTLLSVRGRKSGKIYTIPVALVERSGTRWLVAAFGEVSWVRNLRAAGQAVLSTYSFLLMSFPHSEAFLGSFRVILHVKRPKKRLSAPLLRKDKLVIALS
jgi:hypothetical protein